MSEGQLKGISRTKVAGQTKIQDQVRVRYGVHSLRANLAGRTVGDVRQALRQALNISPQAMAVVGPRGGREHHPVGRSATGVCQTRRREGLIS
jgi:hypothetical protein